MLSIIMLRLQRLKVEYYVFLVMTLMSLIFTFIFGATQNQDYTPTILVVDEDNSDYSKKVFSELQDNNAFKYSISEYDDAVKKVQDDKAAAALVINKGLQENIENNQKPVLGIIKTKENIDTMTLENIISSITSKMVGNIRIASITADFINQEKNIDHNKIFNEAYNKAVETWKYKKPIEISSTRLVEGNGTGYDNLTHSIIGFALFFSMYTIVFAIGEILNEKKYNTWNRILVSPISKNAILGGNLIVSFLVGFVQVGILFIAGKYLFGLNLGSNLLGVIIVLIAFVFTITSMGLFLSGLVKTHSQLAALTPVILTSTSMLGGCMWPLDIVENKIILALSNITPQKWAIEGIESIAMYGKGINGVIIPTLVLLGMGLLFFSTGVKLVKSE
ncbi:ABC transporter permease [Sporosalibacterium faouarense]|uniref:ABC transporter permease n=1 Tax=Sporosalibacterium faouarense TaxID=516123 RepID=UPI00192BA80D|nr:ABC transporter permease [Sporosalibacterium faouarense]